MKRILLVDDEVAQRRLLREILTAAGYDVDDCDCGQGALSALRDSRYDLLLLDRAMPDMNGLDVLRRVRESGWLIPAIMISAFGDEELWAEAVMLGASDYLVRPFDRDVVINAIKKALGE